MATKKGKTKIQSVPGMSDILPKDQAFFKKIYTTVNDFSSFYGFAELTPPILEYTELFEKGTGDDTEIVEKQMYSLRSDGGDYLTLRPEFTPSLVRSYIENGMISLPQPVKLFSYGPVFRHEKPQAGRFRQFNQFNLEVFGSTKPIIDAELIYIFYNILQSLGIKDLTIEINSIGDQECRPAYKKLLLKYLRKNEKFLCSDCKKRLKKNPFRILDCKEERCQQVVSGAPQIIDHLCKECHNHFKKVLEFLDDLGLPYNLNPYLARGLDYYTKTVFEIVTEDKDGKSKMSLLGGGRYDNLVKLFYGKSVPACGGAGGVERIIAAMKEREIQVLEKPKPAIFLAQLGNTAKTKALNVMEVLRRANLPVIESFDKDSLTAQLKVANKLKIGYTLIVAEEEASKNMLIVRNMKTGKQTLVKMERLVKEMKKKLK
jgi:histidyl-tRNA synthetase